MMKGEFDEIELKIKEILEKIAQQAVEDGGYTNEWWTKRIKSELCILGHEKGYSVSATGCERLEKAPETGEWLFDLIWAKGEGHPWIFREMPLARECEWPLNENEIWWDFEKLLVIRSKYRIFIFDKRKREDIERLFNEFNDAIHGFESSQKGDRYLLAGFSCEDNNFKFRQVIA
ncbi:MAG: hypothetical protein ACOZF2_12905 [Thermodesulfobacteriota bacterium]